MSPEIEVMRFQPLRFPGIVPVLCLIFCICQALTGQASTTGMGLDGSTGLFINPSPGNLTTGHMRIGVFSASNAGPGGKIGNLPVAFSLGFSEQLEIMGSLTAWPYSRNSDDQLLSLGAKINILEFEGNGLSVDLRWQDWERAINDTGWIPETALSGRLIGSYPVKGFVIHTNIGYAWRNMVTETNPTTEYPAGIGMTHSFSDQLQALAEYQTDHLADPRQSARWAMGVKWYVLDHLQLAGGVLGMRQYSRTNTGVFLNLAFSTASLKTFFRKIPSWRLIALPSLEELDMSDEGAGSEVSSEISSTVIGTVESPLDPEYANLPVPPPLEELDSWIPDKSWYERYLGREDPSAELPLPPPLDDTKRIKPIDSRDETHEYGIEPSITDDENLPQPPPLELFENSGNEIHD
ncbi:hypothetical protein ACFL45_11455 [Candidatus Neomarinimicrobiota bacterium]